MVEMQASACQCQRGGTLLFTVFFLAEDGPKKMPQRQAKSGWYVSHEKLN